MKKLFSIFISLLILLFNFLYFAPNSTYAAPGCDIAFCTPAECSDSRCNECDFCLICDAAFCTPSDCAQQRCWGCDFCTPDFCDVAFCTPAECGQRRCAACDFCTAPMNCTCSRFGLRCAVENDNCPPGTTATCNVAQCDGSRNSCSCILSFNACAETYGGTCKEISYNVCPDIYDPTPVGGYQELGCGYGEACCVPASSGCVAWNPITGCPGGTTRCPDAQTRCCPNVADCPVYDPDWRNGGAPEVKVPVFCAGSDPANRTTTNTGKLATAIGCIPITGGQEFIAFILGWGIGIGGGIAFLLILYAGFMITTSSGDPKKLQAGRELLTAAIAGLLLLIFSVFILRLIGFTILRLPGFGS